LDLDAEMRTDLAEGELFTNRTASGCATLERFCGEDNTESK
jgi:hypothetical protein